MSLVAVISRTPRLEMAEWLRRIELMDELVPPPPREANNPFTGQCTTLTSKPGTVEIIVSGTLVGAIEPSTAFDDDGELHVYAPERPVDALQSTAAAVAGALGADIQWTFDDVVRTTDPPYDPD